MRFITKSIVNLTSFYLEIVIKKDVGCFKPKYAKKKKKKSRVRICKVYKIKVLMLQTITMYACI